MFNLCFICGEVFSEPELRFTEGQPDSHIASFSMDTSLWWKSHGWIRIYCYQELAALAAEKLHKGTRVLVVGPLVRLSLKIAENIWWSEPAVVAHALEVIE